MTSRYLQLFLAAALLGVPAAIAQTVTGAITGTVRDSTSATIPNASVSVVNEDTNVELKTTTNSSGDYNAPVLPAGNYTVRVEAAGFRPYVTKGLVLLPNRTLRQDFTLEVGQVQQTVEVRQPRPVVNSESATIGNIMQSDQITTLPLNGRMLDRLIRISAGVTTDSASNPRVAGSAYWGGITSTSTASPSTTRATAAARTRTATAWRRCLRSTRSANSRSIPTTRRRSSKARRR